MLQITNGEKGKVGTWMWWRGAVMSAEWTWAGNMQVKGGSDNAVYGERRREKTGGRPGDVR